MQSYTTFREKTAADYGGVSVLKPIQAAKEAVRVEELAERLSGPGLPTGAEVLFCCPLHDDAHPSMRVNPEKQVWHCFPCGEGGDVVRLAQRAWGHPDDGRGAAEAAAYLLLEFGRDLPERPPSWFARQKRQASVRDGVEAEKIEHVRMLIFRLIWMPWLKRLPEWVRDEAAESAWESTRTSARQLYERMAAKL